MTNQLPSIVEVLINWFPMLLLIAVWIIFMRRMGSLGKGKAGVWGYYEALLEENKRHNEALEKILARLEERLPK